MTTTSSYPDAPVLHSFVSFAEGWWADLAERHEHPTRHYHTIAHVFEVVQHWLTAHQDGAWKEPIAPLVAALLHDVVYDVHRSDNEQASAALVPEWTASWMLAPVEVRRVQDLILHTAHHGRHPGSLDDDAALFVDCDMAVLASTPERFRLYEHQIRQEWEPVVGPEGYAAGRRRFFEGLVGRPIYQSDYGRSKWEDLAQRNLQKALSAAG